MSQGSVQLKQFTQACTWPVNQTITLLVGIQSNGLKGISSLTWFVLIRVGFMTLHYLISRHKSLYENLQNKVSEMSRSRRKSSVGEMDELTQVNENMKSKLEKANAVYKQVIHLLPVLLAVAIIIF